MNRNNINWVALVVSAVILVTVIATVIILDRMGIGIEDVPIWGDNDNKVEDTTVNEGDKTQSTEKNEVDIKDNIVENTDKVVSDNKDNVDSGTAVGGKPSNDKTDKNNNTDDSKKPEGTKKPVQNGSSDKNESSDSSDTADTNDKETEGNDEPYVPEPMTYTEYIAMSPEDQQAYFESFEDMQDYFDWYNDALDKYEADQNKQEADGPIDIGEIINGGGN